jgi:hypothetical protein
MKFVVSIRMATPGGFAPRQIEIDLPPGITMESADQMVRDAIFERGSVSYRVVPAQGVKKQQ